MDTQLCCKATFKSSGMITKMTGQWLPQREEEVIDYESMQGFISIGKAMSLALAMSKGKGQQIFPKCAYKARQN